MKKIAIFVFLIISNYKILYAQKEGNIWYFGNYAGISFNSTTPSALTNGQLSQREGCSSVCDKNGNLLFYTDGQKVYDRTHTLMSNGNGLLGNNSSCQSGVIIPWPDSTNKYFVISVDAIENSATYGVRYSVVDMRLRSGYGDVVSSEKNIVLIKPQCEKATAVLHCNRRDFWLITNQPSSDSILAFLISPTGINKKAVRSNTGFSISGNLNNNLGYLNPSHDGTKLASCHFLMDKVLLMDFNNQTGKVSNTIILSKAAAYCAEFSPNNKSLYVSGLRSPTSIDQFDISSNSQSTIQSSKRQIFDYGSGEMGALKLGPDGKIYATSETTTNGYNTYLGIINTPDSLGPYFRPKGIYLSGKSARLGLPNIFYSHKKIYSISIVDTCLNNTSLISLSPNNNQGSIKWNFDDTASGAQNTSTSMNASHKFTKAGKYKITGYFSQNCLFDTIIRIITIPNPSQKFTIGNDTSICPNTSLTLIPNINGTGYLWSNNATTKSINISKPGKFWVKVTNNCVSSSDTITINDKTSGFKTNFPKDTLLCNSISGYPLIVSSNYQHQTNWNNGPTNDTLIANNPGSYIAIVTHICGTIKDTVQIEKFIKGPSLKDTTICFPVNFSLNKISTNYLLWQTKDTSHQILISSPGTYTVKEYKKHCIVIDTVEILPKSTVINVALGNDTSVCLSLGFVLKTNRTDTKDRFLWSTSDTTSTIQIKTAGTYWVKVINSCGTGYDTIKIMDKFNNLKISFPKDTLLCKPFSKFPLITFCNSLHTSLWNTGEKGDTILIDKPGIYTVQINNICGIIKDTIQITQFIPGPRLRDTSICFPSNFTLNKSSVNSILWQTGDTTSNININSPGNYVVQEKRKHCINKDTISILSKTKSRGIELGNDTLYCNDFSRTLSLNYPDIHTTLWNSGSKNDSIKITSAGIYSVKVTDVCNTFYDTITIEKFNHSAKLGRDTFICFSSPFEIKVPLNNNYNYQWNTGSMENKTIVLSKGQYIVRINYKSCTIKDTFNILTNDSAINQIFIPNSFTPNDDLLNDYFPFDKNIKPIDIEIYNRWGERIFQASNTYLGWNGNYDGKIVENGVYLYMIHYKDCMHRDVFTKGTFTVSY